LHVSKANASHHEPARKGMPKIMPAEMKALDAAAEKSIVEVLCPAGFLEKPALAAPVTVNAL